MLDWYHLFLAAVFLLWLGATDADRNALRIVLAATISSLLLVDFVTSQISGAWKLVIPGALETGTVVALIRWTPNRSGYQQTACVMVAWLAHVLCFADIQLRTDIVYSHYEAVLGVVAMAQIAFFHDTYLHHLRRLGRWWGSNTHPGAVPASGFASVVSHHPGHSRLSPIPPCTTRCTKP